MKKGRTAMENKDIIELTREVGRQLQREEVYIAYQAAKQAADDDKQLQELIEDFDKVRTDIAVETAKDEDDRDNEKIRSLNERMRKVYAKIMTNERMIGYNDAKDEFDALMARITAIIQQSSEGNDPDTADYAASCSGNCAACGGC